VGGGGGGGGAGRWDGNVTSHHNSLNTHLHSFT